MGRFPPTPKLQRAQRIPIAANEGDEPAVTENTLVNIKVKLNAHFRPITSADKGQKAAPHKCPKFCARVRSGARPGGNAP